MKPAPGLALGLLASALLAFACGSDDPPAAPVQAGGSAGVGNAGDGGVAGGAGVGAAAGASGASAGNAGAAGGFVCPEAGPRPQATVDLVQRGAEATGSAFFPLVTVPAPGSECVHRTEDSCYLETCLRPLPAAPLACVEERGTGVNAGLVTFTGGTGSRTLSFDGNAKPPGYPVGKGGALFTGGETVTIAATGAIVPAFQTALLAPIAITFPTLSPNLVIQRAQGLALTWAESAKAPIVLMFSSTETVEVPSASKETRVVCTFAGTALQAKVPAKALADLPLGPVGFTVTQVSSNVVEAGNWDVTVRVIANQIDYGATLQ